MRVLQFVSLLFIRIAPNHTAWCKAVEDFLDGMGYKLTTEVSESHVQDYIRGD